MNRLRIGLSGCGQRGAEVVAAVRAHGACEIAALHDPDPAALARLGRIVDGAARATDYPALLQSGVDFVVLTGPCGDRLAQVTTAAEQGAHCLLHAPMAIDAATAAAMVAVCDRNKVKIGVVVPQQADPLIEQIRQMIADDWLGTPTIVTSLIADDRGLLSPPPADDWRRDPARTGRGPLLRLATEHLHLAIWLCERQPTRAAAIASRGFSVFDEDSAAAVLLLRGGTVFTLASSQLCAGSALAIHGTDGAVRLAADRVWLRGRKAFPGDAFVYPKPHEELMLPIVGDVASKEWEQTELHGRFARWIDDCDDFPCPGEQAVLDMRAIDAIRRAIDGGTTESI